MTPSYGIDTSVLVRLLTGEPASAYGYCVESLKHLVHDEGVDVFVSNQVIGEAYVTVQHHYRVSHVDAKDGLMRVLQSGLVRPLNGRQALQAIKAKGGPGLFDRLIADDYIQRGIETLTLDRKMATLTATRML